MKTRQALSLLLALCLLWGLAACGQSGEDKKFDELTKKTSSAPVPGPASGQPQSAPEGSSEAAPTSEPTPYVDPEGLEGEFTVKGPFSTSDGVSKDAVEELANEFMALHPGVKINVEFIASIYDGTPRAQRRENARTQLLAELGSGEADYLLYSPIEELNIYGLSQSGVFTDLRPYFENDPDIDPDDFYTQVLDAVSVDGKLTVMPMSFDFNGVMLNRPLLEGMQVDLDSIRSVDYKQLLDWYDQAKSTDPDVQATFGALTQDYFFTYEAPAYVDLENKAASFNSPEFIEFLARTGALEESDKDAMDKYYRLSGVVPYTVQWAMENWEAGTEFSEEQRQFLPDHMLAFYDNAHPGVAALSGIMAEEIGYFGGMLDMLAGPYPIVSTKGQLGVYTTEDFAIPASMKSPDLAWEFISYCIQEREDMVLGQGLYTGRLPINKKTFAHQMEFCRTSRMVYSSASFFLKDFQQKNLDPALCAQKLEEFMALPLTNSKVYVIDMSEYLTEFYDNKLTTPEQCAEKIQGRMDIWLHE